MDISTSSTNRIMTSLTKFDYVFGITLGSTLSRVITGNASTLDMTRAAISLAMIVALQLALAYATTLIPASRSWIRSVPKVVVFRGEMLIGEMHHDAVLPQDIRIALRRLKLLNLSEIVALILEASGGFTVVTRKQMKEAGFEAGQVPDSLVNIPQYIQLCEAAEKIKLEGSAQGTNYTTNSMSDV